MRKIKISIGEYYHIYNRGNDKQIIFLDERDRVRFLFLLLHMQGFDSFEQIGRQVGYFVRHRVFNIGTEMIKKIIKEKRAELVSFTLMPNHFHLLVGEKSEGGIARYMQRALNAYTKYFNMRHKRSGHLLQGPYQAVHLKNSEQLLYTSAYIHRNCRTIPQWKNREKLYPWSSLQDYLTTDRWNGLLEKKLIQDQFPNPNEYEKWVAESGAKDPVELTNSD